LSYDVFISYSSVDKFCAHAICAALEKHGLRCWIAPRDVVSGETWMSQIMEGIESSELMIVVLSRTANTSPQVQREVGVAVRNRIAVFPVRIEDVGLSREMEYLVSTQHWLDAFTPPMEQHLDRIAILVSQNLAKRRGESTQTYSTNQGVYYTSGTTHSQPEFKPTPTPLPVNPGKKLFVTFVNPRTGERKQVRTGFSSGMFFGSSFFGLPLFGIVFFRRELYTTGAIYFLGSLFCYSMMTAGQPSLAFFTVFIFLCLSVFVGIRGNQITAVGLVRRGWTILDDGTGLAAAARQRWGL
jgi:TIR domain